MQWPNTHTANGGFIYIQNAHPSGPSVWIFLEATDRLLRHAADNWAWMQAKGLKKQCKHMDQVSGGRLHLIEADAIAMGMPLCSPA